MIMHPEEQQRIGINVGDWELFTASKYLWSV